MTEAPLYPPGTPSWVDLGSPDLEGSKKFYGSLFGWQAETAPVPEAGGYTLFRSKGKLVSAVSPLMNPEQPPAWNTYVASEDVEATTQRVREAGGQVVIEPMTIMEAGRMAGFLDPTGAFILAWQPDQHRGAELVNEPNSFSWNELATRDVEAAKKFYHHVFGWEGETNSMPDGGSYTEWKLNGRSIGGAMEMGDQYPAGVPPHWLTYFSVADIEAAAKQVEELGGKITVPPTTIGPGRFAVVVDPQGATFALFAAT